MPAMVAVRHGGVQLKRPTALALALALAGAAPAAGQYRGEVEVDAVVIPVTVRTAAGRVVSEVPAKKFRLFVDGLEYAIPGVERETDLPISLGFVVDTSGSMGGRKVSACRQMVLAFLAERRPDDEVTVWTFGGERVMERFPFGTPLVLLPRVLELIRPWSVTALYDMVQRVPEVMGSARHHRRAVILLTDGIDNASRVDHQQATALARSLNTPFYVLGVEPAGRPDSASGPTYEQALELIAELSGGTYQRVPSVERMGKVVEEMLRELSSRFIISISTSGIGARVYRRVDVQVEGFRATTREGYVGTLP